MPKKEGHSPAVLLSAGPIVLGEKERTRALGTAREAAHRRAGKRLFAKDLARKSARKDSRPIPDRQHVGRREIGRFSHGATAKMGLAQKRGTSRKPRFSKKEDARRPGTSNESRHQGLYIQKADRRSPNRKQADPARNGSAGGDRRRSSQVPASQRDARRRGIKIRRREEFTGGI